MTTLKSVILGLDGATWKWLQPLMELGVLPHLKTLLERGSRGILRSTEPPITGPAWTTMFTGKNPGQHGVFDWGLIDHNYVLKMLNTTRIADQPLWMRLSDLGRRVGVFSVPFTYPPDPVNGFVVCGMGTPGPQYPWAYPAEVKDAILDHFGGSYIFNVPIVNYAATQYDQLVDHIVNLEDKRTAILLRLVEQFTLDDLIVVYGGTDWIGHFLGHSMDFAGRSDLDGLSAEQEAIIRYYRSLDRNLEQLMALIGPDTLLMIVSDHGFTVKDKNLFLNEWLRREGYLTTTLTSRLKARAATWLSRLKSQAAGRVVTTDHRDDGAVVEIMQENRFDSGLHLGQRIVWSNTRAFSNSQNGLYINTVGRFSQGIVQPGSEYDALRAHLTDQLLALRDPLTGEPVIEAVRCREEVYSGSFADQTPDLLIQFRADRYMTNRYFFSLADSHLRVDRSVFGWPVHSGRGDHHHDGILAVSGPVFRSGSQLDPASIEDVSPTLLHALGFPVPDGMTGNVVEQAFTESHRRAHPIQIVADPALKSTFDREDVLTHEEERLVYERLKELGYME